MMRDLQTTYSFDLSLARPDVLGPVTRDGGTNFALFSDHAEKVELCLYDPAGKTELARIALPEMEGGIWYGFVPGIGAGQVYGYRVHGPYAPEQGHRFNPNKLLLDPYAREIIGAIDWDDSLFGYQMGAGDLTFDDRDSAPFMPKGVVVDDMFDWHKHTPLNHRWKNTVMYEAHVKGLTMRHPGVIKADRGTFAGLSSEPVIDHLKALGVTAIELLPIHAFANDQHLIEKGLSNYWGYNTLSFFAPHAPYLKSGRIAELKSAIDRFHKAGIEVILDVVYNHTCEGNENGPTLSYRGIDNASYYLLSEENPRHGFDTTGTGNTLNVAHPMVLRMVMDSLRYWVQVCHVDGFRFDLASTLGRDAAGFDREGAFFAAMRQDPILSAVKLIAEPWDIGEGGYQVGGFPWPFREWNDKTRDDVRAFWRRDPGLVPALSERLCGSPVQFNHSHRPATSSINFVAVHDGLTLWDTVSYDNKHNEANGEDGRDGHDNNLSHNLGAEGPSDDPGILEARNRRAAAMLATIALSQGVPLILAGDEFGQSQGGNNNGYAQDNETTWLNWEGANLRLQSSVARALALRGRIEGLIDPRFGTDEDRPDQNQITWYHPAGHEMQAPDWQDSGLMIFAKRIRTAAGEDLLIVLNAGDDAAFTLPEGSWVQSYDSSATEDSPDEARSGQVDIAWQSVSLWQRG
jgi:isoamylase